MSASDRCDSHGVVVRVAEPLEFFSDPSAWDALVERAGIDPVFNGHAWQSAWWDAFAERNSLEPFFVEVRRGQTVIARMPMLRRRLRIKGWPVRTLELAGNLWRGPATMRSEFLDLHCAPADRDCAIDSVVEFIAADRGWDVMVLLDLAGESGLCGGRGKASERWGYRRILQASAGYEVRIAEGSFDDFKQRQSAASRRRMFGGRHKLAAAGRPDLQQIVVSGLADLQVVDDLHCRRWGAPLLGGGRDEFFRFLIDRAGPGRLQVSQLTLDSKPISAMLELCGDTRTYNVQGGFDSSVVQGVSVGRLHLGYRIEKAYEYRSPQVIDLLEGAGRRDDFKSNFASRGRPLASLQFVRNGPLRFVAGLKDWLEGARTFDGAPVTQGK